LATPVTAKPTSRTRSADRAASPRTVEALRTMTGADGRISGFFAGVARGVAAARRAGVPSAVGVEVEVGAAVGVGVTEGDPANDGSGLGSDVAPR
jgi:hypothetical protein